MSEISREKWTSRSMGPKDPKYVNSNMVTSRHVIKCQKLKAKKEFWNYQEKREFTDKDTPISEFLNKNLSGQEWYSQNIKRKTFQPRILYPAKLSSRNKGETKTLPNKSWGSSWPLDLSSEKAMATHSSTLAWKIPWTEEPGRLQSMGSLRVWHNWATSLSLCCFGEGNGNPLQCSCLENPRDRGAWSAAVSGVA